jgi:hypothetical protein
MYQFGVNDFTRQGVEQRKRPDSIGFLVTIDVSRETFFSMPRAPRAPLSRSCCGIDPGNGRRLQVFLAHHICHPQICLRSEKVHPLCAEEQFGVSWRRQNSDAGWKVDK